MTWLVLVGCNGPDDETGPTTFSDEQGVIAAIRSSSGERVEGDPQVFVGDQTPATPDSAGLTYFFDVTPDRVPVTFRNDGFAYGYAAPEVRVDTVAGVSFVGLAFDETLDLDGADPLSFAGDGFLLEAPAGIAVAEDLPVSGPYTVAAERIGPDERDSVVPVQAAIRNDDDLVPVVMHEMITTRAWQGDGAVRLADGELLTMTLELDPGSPLLADGVQVDSYQMNSGLLYWGRAGEVTLDPVASTATFQVGGFGWYALGIEQPFARGCVTGRLVQADGEDVPNSEVRSAQEGIAGVDGAYSLDGSFCVPVDPGATTELRALAFARDRTRLYRWRGTAVGSAPANCGDPACTDLGTLEVQEEADDDRDRFFSGPGGDCDDADPEVNPTFAFGDGSWCGGAF